jgi:hypothetical protein
MSQLFNQTPLYEDFLATDPFAKENSSPNKKIFGYEDDMIDPF